MLSFILKIGVVLIIGATGSSEKSVKPSHLKEVTPIKNDQALIQELILNEFLDRHDSLRIVELFRATSPHFGAVNNTLINDCIADSLKRSFHTETYTDFTEQNGPLNDSINLVSYKFGCKKKISNIVLSMSNCGFSNDFTQAMMYYEITWVGLGGGGAIAVFRKNKKGWFKECEVWPWKG